MHLLDDHEREYRDEAEHYYEHGLAMLMRCDALVVLQLDGWRDSRGVCMERVLASARGIPITYIGVRLLDESDDATVRALGALLHDLGESSRPRT